MIERDYKITPTTFSFGEMYKVEMWNDYGMKRTIYEENLLQSSKMIMDWWEDSDKEYGKMKSLNRAIKSCIEIDQKSGILTGNRDSLD